MHSIVGDLRTLFFTKMNEHPCDLHLSVARCRFDCLFASFVQLFPWMILKLSEI